MKSHKNAVAYDVVATLMAYLIFAFSLLAVNMIKYPMIKMGFYSLLIVSGALIFYTVHNLNKDLIK